MSAFTEAVERNLKGVHFFSVGACPGCEECGLEAPGADGDQWFGQEHERRRAAVEEGFFVNSASCDSCGSTLGGQRYPAHGVIAETMWEAQKPGREITHFDVCVDCVLYHANGEEPETWQ